MRWRWPKPPRSDGVGGPSRRGLAGLMAPAGPRPFRKFDRDFRFPKPDVLRSVDLTLNPQPAVTHGEGLAGCGDCDFVQACDVVGIEPGRLTAQGAP